MKHLARHGGGHRRARDPGPRGRARDAAPRLERELARHARPAWRTGSCRRPASPLDTHRASAACAARAWSAHADRRAAPARRVLAAARASAPRAAPTPCSAWAATSASRAAGWRGCTASRSLLVNADAALLLSNQRAAAGRATASPSASTATRRASTARTRSSPATRCAPRSRRWPTPAERFAGRGGALRLLVVGGSLGAQVLNEMRAAGARAASTAQQRPQVTHQTGEAGTRRGARRLRRRAGAERRGAALHRRHGRAPRRLRPDRLPRRRDHGQRAVRRRRRRACWCRSIVSTTSHQRDNAAWMAARGAAIHLPQAELSPRTARRPARAA